MVLPRSGGYWCDDGSDTAAAPADPSQTASCKLELDETARCYRRFFVGKVSVTLEILVSFSFSPLRSKLKGKLRKTKRESGGFVRSLLHRVCGGGGCVTQLRAGLRISRLPMGSFRAVSKVTARPHLRDLATFPFTFIRWHYNPRHADIFI